MLAPSRYPTHFGGVEWPKADRRGARLGAIRLLATTLRQTPCPTGAVFLPGPTFDECGGEQALVGPLDANHFPLWVISRV